MIRQSLYKIFSLLAEPKIRQLQADSHSPREAQARCLSRILKANEESSFGREHNFAKLATIEDFQKALPIREYEQFRPYVDRMINGEKAVLTSEQPLQFATTSGTIGQQKFIPVTPGYIREFRHASVVSGYYLLQHFPGIAYGTTLSMASPAQEGLTPSGIPYGAISGQLFRSEPFLIKKYISPIPYEVFLIKDYETRYYTILRLALQLPVSLFYTLNPSTIGLLCRRLQKYGPSLVKDVRDGTTTPPSPLPETARRAIEHMSKPAPERARQLQQLLDQGTFLPYKIWPSLQLVSCWTKAAASFYLSDLNEYFPDIPVCDITYGASEGRGTVFLSPEKQMLAIHSHFFEFIPEEQIDQSNPAVLLADQLTEGRNYYILFTTSGGLYRYHINDVVKVTGFHNKTPLLEFQYKGGNICSFTGEKITELQVTAAMKTVLRDSGARVRFFTLIPQFRPEPHYDLWIEPDLSLNASAPHDLAQTLHVISQKFDEQLSVENVEYKTKRESGRLGTIGYQVIKPGSYEAFRRSLTAKGIPDAQIKISHLNPKEETKSFFEGHITSELTASSTLLGIT